MRDIFAVSVAAALVGFVGTGDASSVYEGERRNVRSGERDIQVSIRFDRSSASLALFMHGKHLVSLLETDRKITIVDHAAQAFVEYDYSPSARSLLKADDSEWQKTARRQFGIGSYCGIEERGATIKVRDERCVVPIATLFDAESSRAYPMIIGRVLEEVAVVEDQSSLLQRLTAAVARQVDDDSLPVIIRRFDATGLQYELRLTRAARTAVLFPAAEIKKFRRVDRAEQLVDGAATR